MYSIQHHEWATMPEFNNQSHSSIQHINIQYKYLYMQVGSFTGVNWKKQYINNIFEQQWGYPLADLPYVIEHKQDISLQWYLSPLSCTVKFNI